MSNFSFALMVGLLVEDMNANLLIDKNPTYIRTIWKEVEKKCCIRRWGWASNSVVYFVHDDKK